MSSGADGTVRIWEPGRFLKNSLIPANEVVRSVDFSPKGDFLVTGNVEGVIELWSVNSQTEPVQIGSHVEEVTGVGFSPSGELIASSGKDGWIRVWDINGNKINERQLNPRNDSLDVLSVSFNQNEKQVLYSDTDGNVHIWDLENQDVISFKKDSHPDYHGDWVDSAKFSPNGKYVVTASDDDTVRLWDADGKLINIFSGHGGDVEDVEFSPSGNYIYSASRDGTIRTWNLRDSESEEIFYGHKGFVNDISLGEEHGVIFSASQKGFIRIWNLDGEELYVLKGHSLSIPSLEFSSKSNLLVSTGEDGRIILWSFNPTPLVKKGCELLYYYLKNPQIPQEDRGLCQDLEPGSSALL